MTLYCRATLNYAARAGSEHATSAVEVDIGNGREAGLPGWTDTGFQLLDHRSAITDWDDDDQIVDVHYREAEDLVRRITGCDAALVSDHVRRAAEPVPAARQQTPVRLVHSDFAAGYDSILRSQYENVRGRGAAALARAGITPEQICAASRVVMIQLWRNVGPLDIDLPIAFCDARTVRSDEGRPFPYTGYVAGGRAFDALAIAAPADPGRHAWFTYPSMTADEVVLFRTYDSDKVLTSETYFTPHSAFHDPRPQRPRPRRSVELRVACLYK